MTWVQHAYTVIAEAFTADRTGPGYRNRGVEDAQYDAKIALDALAKAGLSPTVVSELKDHRAVHVKADGADGPGPMLSPHRWCLEDGNTCDCPVVRRSYSTHWLEVRR